MGKKYKKRIFYIVCTMVVMFGCIAAMGIHFGAEYIEKQVLLSNQNDAVDIAMLINKNFEITDAEVNYLKALTFNQMERDPINQRLMDTNDGLILNNKISNIYILIPLSDEEIRYTVDEETAEFFGCGVGTKLNGMWLLNGKFDENGKFQVATREDIYRYIELCPSDIRVFESRKSFGIITEDAWGKFITGYTPIYTVEGSFVGILGVDMAMDLYRENVSMVTNTLIIAFSAITLAMSILFLVFYTKYMKAKEGQLYFEFYSRMSHDMRTPMNGILGIASLSKSEEDAAILKHNYEIIEESGRYMLGLINDTLDVQKLGTGRLKLEPKIRNMYDMFESIMSIIKSNARQKDIHIKIEMIGVKKDKYCYADEIRLQQIVLNIVSNAIKFTPENGEILIRLENHEARDQIEQTKLTIEDSGIGMSKDFIAHHLFQPYAQEQNSITTQYGGTGLGLSIVKNLINLMNGKIDVESELGKGTKFTIYLDFKEAPKEEIEEYILESKRSKAEDQKQLNGYKVLLCEDHPLNILVAQKLLEKFGMAVEVAHNGEEGVQMYEQSRPGYYDGILMDIRMPKMDGIEATQKIRSLKKEDSKLIPIIAMTANAYEEDKEHCKKAGMNGHISKPIDSAVLYQTLVKIIIEKHSGF